MGSWFSLPSWDPKKDLPDLSGKIALVTGANAGIGYHTAEELALHGAKVYIGARSERRAHAAIERLHIENPTLVKGAVVYLPLNLSDLDDVVKAVEVFLQQEKRLDILVNNAGMITNKSERTPQGYEATIGVNYMAHFLLTKLLLPTLKATATKEGSNVRIINTSSSGHTMLVPTAMQFNKLDDLQYPGRSQSYPPYSGQRDLFSRYAVSKVANILHAAELQRQFDIEKIPIIAASFNPGGNNTEGALSVFPRWLRPIMSRIMNPPTFGARPALFLAASPDATRFKGAYLEHTCQLGSASVIAKDPQRAKNLWDLSESEIDKYLASSSK
ncbi:hypothetical protein B7463_g2345, partial [Scytalidium lignicola]